VIERKLALDEIDFDGTTFKDWGGVIRRARWSRLREQIGYKLTALLTQRLEIPPGAEEILLGDDLEADPLVYALYADILAGRLLGAQLQALLVAHGVAAEDAEVICERADSVRSDGSPMGVRRAFIRLERHDDPIALVGYAPGIVACHSALQSAAVLWQMGCIAIDGVARVGADLIRRGMSEPALLAQLRDLVVRALLERNEAEQLNWKLREADVVGLELDGDPSVVAAWAAAANGSAAGMWTPEHVRERVRDGMLEGG
jgi:hypothetical protein